MTATLKCTRCGRDGHLPADCKVPVLPDDRVLATGSDDRKAVRTDFQSYLDDCDECSIAPDVAGAFHAGWQAGRGHTAQFGLLTDEERRKLQEAANHLDGDGHVMGCADADWAASWIRQLVGGA